MTLEAYFRLLANMGEFGYGVRDVEDMIPWEREIHTILLVERLKLKEKGNG